MNYGDITINAKKKTKFILKEKPSKRNKYYYEVNSSFDPSNKNKNN